MASVALCNRVITCHTILLKTIFLPLNDTLLIESHYLGNIQYYAELLQHPFIVLEQYEFFEKSTYRNRCYIAGSNGKLMLSIPLIGGRQQRTMTKDVRIDYSYPWQKSHWHSLESAYRSTAFFDYYQDSFYPLYKQQQTFLFDFNLQLLLTVFKLLKVERTVTFSEEYRKAYPPEQFTDLRNKIHPNRQTYSSTSFHPMPAYFQIFAHKYGFLPNLSIIDLLFAKGPDALHYLQVD